jgi:hypothetical protein
VAATNKSLRVLTAAAFALPGLAPARVHAGEDDEIAFQYGRYQEGDRDLANVNSRYDPIQVDNLLARGRWTLFDRWKLDFDYVQDTWSGATPIATAPVVFGGNRATAPDGVSGATPFIEGDLFLDSQLRPLALDELGEPTTPDGELVHTLSSASPETRHQVGAGLGYEWDAAELRLGGGASLEDDYRSGFVEAGGAWELGQGATRLELDTSYTHSDVRATLDHDALPYIDTSAYDDDIQVFASTGRRRLEDTRRDASVRLGAMRVLGPDTWVSGSVGYARAGGFLENPYKVVEVGFIDPAQQFRAPPGGFYANVHALLEQRPNARNEVSLEARAAHHVRALDAALQLGYRFHIDDWGIDAHTFDASWGQPLGFGVTVTPGLRFYSQGEADFYRQYLISQQAYQTIVVDPDTGDVVSITPFDASLLPSHFSSDQRLSGFGALSAGVTLSKRFARGIVLDAGFEWYDHRGDWKLGGDGEGDFADFQYYLVSAGLRLDTSALRALAESEAHEDQDHPVHASHHAPAGVMLGHRLAEPGDWMLGLRYAWMRQSGDVLHGARRANDATILANGCDGTPCRTAPDEMTMHMVMLDLGYAPTRWLNLMVMPTFVDMQMDLRPLDGAVPDEHGSHGHQTGGVGDTGLVALLRVLETEGHEVHAGLGIGAPTGSVGEKQRRTHQEDRGYTHYGMQLGSGTWDFLPSLTYNGAWRRVSFGAQASGAVRLEHENDSGYAQGDLFQASAWGGFALTRWLTASARALYTVQGRLRGEYDRRHEDSGPMDFPSSYGGQWWDLGMGMTAAATGGPLLGQRLGIEWLQPLRDDVRGYQLERTGTLVASWSLEF